MLLGSSTHSGTSELSWTAIWPGYIKSQPRHWAGARLRSAVETVEAWLCRHGIAAHRLTTLDVIVPTFRNDARGLEEILNLPVPPAVSTMFIIILDNPANPDTEQCKRVLDARFADNPTV